MTDGEKMVWAAAFAIAQSNNKGWMSSKTEADHALLGYRSARDHASMTGEALGMEAVPSDVEAAVVAALNGPKGSSLLTAAEIFRDEIESRIGRPLRGGK